MTFAISAEDEASNQRMRDRRMVGHPKGLHWMCETHIDAARELTHLKWPEAKTKMKKDIKAANYPWFHPLSVIRYVAKLANQ